MADYDLSLTGAQIDSALNKVHNADATPVDGSTNVVTSDGVHEAVNNIQFANLNNNLVSTDLSSGTNNTTLATSAGIKSYVDTTVANAGLPSALYTFADGNKNSDGNISGCSETSDPDSIASTDGSSITVPSGYYVITWECEHYDTRSASGAAYGAYLSFRVNGTSIGTASGPLDGGYEQFYGGAQRGSESNSFTITVYNDSNNGRSYWQNCRIRIMKLI